MKILRDSEYEKLINLIELQRKEKHEFIDKILNNRSQIEYITVDRDYWRQKCKYYSKLLAQIRNITKEENA